MTSYIPESAYADDPRVVWSTSGSPPDVVAHLLSYRPDSRRGDGGWMVMSSEDDGGYVVKGATDRTLTLRDGWNRLRVYPTVDEAIRAVLDAPISGQVA